MAFLTIRSGATQMSEDVFLAFYRDFLANGGVVSTSGTDLKVAAQSVPDMTVKVQLGRVYIKGASSNAYPGLLTADSNVNVTANSSGNSRIDSVVAYIDLSASADTTGSNVAKLAVIAGTPAASPTAPDASAIQAVIGASNPYEVLANVTVGNGVTSIVNGNIADVRRKFLTVADANAQTNAACYGEDAGSNDTYVISLTPAPTAYVAGMSLIFKANTENTGACSLDVNGLGAVALKILKDQDPIDGYIKAGSLVHVVYDGTNFVILSVTSTDGLNKLVTVADGATITFDLSLGAVQNTILGGNRALAATNIKVGKFFQIDLTQDATGSRTVTWFPCSSNNFATTDVNAGTDIITVPINIPTGTPIIFRNTGGGAPAGLTAGTRYFAINNSATSIKVATTLANAQAGTAIDITSQGTGTHSVETHIRWAGGGSEPTLTTGKHQTDSFVFKCRATGVVNGYVAGQDV